MQTEVQGLRVQIKSLKAEMKPSNAKIEELKGDVEALKARELALMNLNVELQDENPNSNVDVATLQNELSHEKKLHEQTKERIGALVSENDAFKREQLRQQQQQQQQTSRSSTPSSYNSYSSTSSHPQYYVTSSIPQTQTLHNPNPYAHPQQVGYIQQPQHILTPSGAYGMIQQQQSIPQYQQVAVSHPQQQVPPQTVAPQATAPQATATQTAVAPDQQEGDKCEVEGILCHRGTPEEGIKYLIKWGDGDETWEPD
eukprot:TRINITY_DN3067_c0_g1_i1.p1 TRINITY_DN3067_c0_g1~~TRINITY_DN3067_c0_g1_i1.p1  ORF type:complete len:256 (+),score=41.95 TRINITY_DN3067_c0_g1_i1:390-1157(+)